MFESDKPVAINTLISDIALRLCDRYCNKPLCQQYAWWAVESITHKTKHDLLMHEHITLTENQASTLHTWIQQQVEEQIPLQYLIGSVPFAECEIIVEPPILIPRPETEEWIIRYIDLLKKNNIKPKRILDMGTGSGCIAISCARAFPDAVVVACDISSDALELAQKNAHHNNVSISCIQSDLFENLPAQEPFDIIISNPPYISVQEWKKLDPSVKNWEDNCALIAPENGLGLLKQIINAAPQFLISSKEFNAHKIPNLLVEIGHTQGASVKTLFQEAAYEHILIQKDLFGNDRLVSGYYDACSQTEK